MGSDETDALGRIDALMETVASAHTIIYARHRRLVERGLVDETTSALLRESVAIALERAPELARGARELALDQAARRLLDPTASDDDGLTVTRAIAQAAEQLLGLLRRQQQIAYELVELDKRGPTG